jgi:hypothetical protein
MGCKELLLVACGKALAPPFLPPTTTEIDQCMDALIDIRKGGANALQLATNDN